MARRPSTELKRDKATDRAYVRHDGRKVYFGQWGQEAFKKYAKWLSSLSPSTSPIEPTDGKVSVSHCADLYDDHARVYYSKDGIPSQEYRNVSAAISEVCRKFGSELAADFGPRKLLAIQQDMASRLVGDSTNLKYARTTINSRIDRIRRMFRWCVSQELIPASVITALETVPGLREGRGARESKPVRPVPMDVVFATLPHLSPTVAAMVAVQYLCGMRPQDVCGMTTGAIDRSSEIWLYRPLLHKNSHRGQLLVKAIPKAAQSVIEPHLRSELDEPLFSPLDTMAHFAQLSRKPSTKPKQRKRTRRDFYTTAAYGKSIRYAVLKINRQRGNDGIEPLPHWTPNQLRHAIATDVRRTAGIEAAQAFLGHAKPDVTLLYAEQTVQALTEIARGISWPPAQAESSPQPH